MTPAANPLAAWMATSTLTWDGLAQLLALRDVKVRASSLRNLANNQHRPSLALALALQDVSKGKVPAAAWEHVKIKERG